MLVCYRFLCPTHLFYSIQFLNLGCLLAVTLLLGLRGMHSTRSSVKRAQGSTFQGPCLSTWSPLWLTRWRPGRTASFSILSSSSHTRKMLQTTLLVDITQVWHVVPHPEPFPREQKCFLQFKMQHWTEHNIFWGLKALSWILVHCKCVKNKFVCLNGTSKWQVELIHNSLDII